MKAPILNLLYLPLLCLLLQTSCQTSFTSPTQSAPAPPTQVDSLPTTGKTTDTAQSVKIEATSISQDRDADGWTDIIDLCPTEYAPDGLGGCLPLPTLTLQTNDLPVYQEVFAMPFDPAGRINVFGDRFLVLTNYQDNTLNIYDLSNGALLRKLNIPNILNDSPTLLQQGILLKNYDQQHWRLLDFNGLELFSADEELEIINLPQNLLVSRVGNQLILRRAQNPQTVWMRIPGMYAVLDHTGQQLAVSNPQPCSLAVYQIPSGKQTMLTTLDPLSEVCRQTAQFSMDSTQLISIAQGKILLYSIADQTALQTFAGTPLALLSNSLILKQGKALIRVDLSTMRQQMLARLSEEPIRSLAVDPQEQWIAFLIKDPTQQNSNKIDFLSLNSGKILFTFPADNLLLSGDQLLLWQTGDSHISRLHTQTFQEISKLDTIPLLGIKSAISGNYLLVSGQDQQLHVYRVNTIALGQ
jgi:WD40 repeat protein